ncbi:LPP20 family lipoprotein [Anaeromyxobacter paludicola]|uniref:LPP20 lipoprotein n=1 Tax=Anaeromyxobacter paludicola TaxID=2918171 RepID=A0ABM7X9F2_9BACT|nr:LPP20 family lipoprotein [Anaeromyxobacter paludicola]BDG08479.1 hypothetical protein AMPC_15920 [Anaeromyxobacter paludicola]
MNRRFQLALSAGLAAVLSACAGGQKEAVREEFRECEGPLWTCFKSGPCPVAELKGNLCATGIAENIASQSLGIETASTRARVEMGAVIKSQVDGFTRATQDSLSKQGAGEDSVQKIGSMAQNVVEQTLTGVSIQRTWQNKQTKVFYALATIDPQAFASALKGMKEAKGLSDAMKQEIDRRAEGVVADWQAAKTAKAQ